MTTIDPKSFEGLGVFYLGREVPEPGAEAQAGSAASPPLLLYDAKDLTTHAVVVGMTGSGKTGLCIDLLEEAALDGVPSLVIDPKGDVCNLLLTFPELRGEDFAPWIDPGEATRAGMDVEEFARATAERWREGLADWGQHGTRIARLRAAAEMTIYTPGSTAGRPLSVLRSFAVPNQVVLADADALGDRIACSVDGLLALLGIEADPVQSREHILLSNLLADAWRGGRSLDLGALIRGILKPPFARLGVLDLETFYPASDRSQLAMRLNGLLASPGFAAWLEGDPIDAGRLLFTESGKPRVAIVSIAHLSDAERMFTVTLLLNEVIAWMRSQPGTSSLRATIYMDEIYGFFPPVAEPPAKRPMLTLLKQARAFGVGVVLATQNPADLDYKGLANCGTWFVGRLQTERDRARLLDGLAGAGASSGHAVDRAQLERLLASLGKRVFLMHNVHEQEPVLFETRWAMSYLRGPLTREQIARLQGEAAPGAASPIPAAGSPAPEGVTAKQPEPEPPAQRPVLPEGVEESVVAIVKPPAAGAQVLYRPFLFGKAQLHFKQRGADGIDLWRPATALKPLTEGAATLDWSGATELGAQPTWAVGEPEATAGYQPLPEAAQSKSAYRGIGTSLATALYRTRRLRLWRYADLDLASSPDEELSAFRQRVVLALTEQRDRDVEQLRQRFAGELEKVESRMQRAQERLDREKAQAQEKRWSAVASVGTSVLGALLGRKKFSVANVSRAGSALRSFSRTRKEQEDVGRAEDRLEDLVAQRDALAQQAQSEVDALRARLIDPQKVELEQVDVSPLKSDVEVQDVRVLWRPGVVDVQGTWRALDALG